MVEEAVEVSRRTALGLLDPDPVAAAPSVALGRIVWAGPLTVLTSLAAVHAVRQVVIRLPFVRAGSVAFRPLAVTADTVILCSLAVVVFTLVAAFHDGAGRRFRWIAFGALVASFLPLVHAPEIGDLPTVCGVASMHVAAYIPCVTLLPWITVPQGPKNPSQS
ncbi:MAG TPA: hypothetical protein VGI12_01770 [Vicinamibacterales bacterium]